MRSEGFGSADAPVGPTRKLERRVFWKIRPKISWRDKLVVFSSCDTSYLAYATALIRSLDLFSPGFPFILHLINPTDKDYESVDRCIALLRNTRLALSVEITNLDFLNAEAKRSYYASARFLELPALLRAVRKDVLCLDADSLVVNPIDFKFSDDSSADIVLFSAGLRDHQTPPKWRVKNGTIKVGFTSETIRLFERVSAKLQRSHLEDKLEWYVDQIAISDELLASGKSVSVAHIRTQYLDWEYKGSSIVWAGKGARKYSASAYRVLSQFLSEGRGTSDDVVSVENENRPASIRRKNRVAVFLPRIDLPWKSSYIERPTLPKLSEDTISIRNVWKQFAVLLCEALERQGVPVEMLEWPAWEITPDSVDALGFDLAFIPHRCLVDFHPGRTKIRFYMQEYFRWVFVVDEKGWSAASSVYPLQLESLTPQKIGTFDRYRQRLKSGNLASKFSQAVQRTREDLIASGEIPAGPYIFMPLQIPHDQSIKYFSDLELEEMVSVTLDWSTKSGVPVVIKPHPVNKKSMAVFEQLARKSGAHWSIASIRDLIEYSTGVFTINSGVGFEALFQLKPVAIFGKAEYDCVCFPAKKSEIEAAWLYCLNVDSLEMARRYEIFIDWFLSSYAVDLSDPEWAKQRLTSISEAIRHELTTE